MKTLPPPTAVRHVLSFDFDGTLHDPAATPPVPSAFFALIAQLRETRGAIWGINTGRSMPQLIEGFIESRFPFLPDWVVAREREIWFPNEFGRWLAHEKWNQRCEKDIAKLFKRSRKLLARLKAAVSEHTGARWLEMEGEPAGLIAQTQEEMDWIVGNVLPLAGEEPMLSWQRNSIYLRFSHRDYHKGSGLSAIAALHGLGPAHCFAIGDSHNDLEMLDPAHAGMRACPANSVPEILGKVIREGGLVTRQIHAASVIEALRHFFPQ
ncbi:MAG: HAD hydrolase family protein [Verrucomicrobiota bacterium]